RGATVHVARPHSLHSSTCPERSRRARNDKIDNRRLRFNASTSRSLSTAAACCSAEYSARSGTWRRCVARSDGRACSASRRALVEEIALPFHDLVGNVGNGLLTLMDRLDQKFAAPDLVANVILHFAAVAILRHDVFVGIADAQVRNLFTI